MPDITGVQFLKSLENKPKVIFTTAYPDYAIEGFNLDAVDYLLKPFAFERFLKAANKAYQQIRSLQKVSPAVQATAQKKYMFIKSGYDTVKVNFKDILFIEGAKDYVTIYMKEKKIMMLISMKAMLELLPVNNFVRIHRSYIVALDKIDLIQTQDVQIGKKELPIGETYKREFLTLIDNLK